MKYNKISILHTKNQFKRVQKPMQIQWQSMNIMKLACPTHTFDLNGFTIRWTSTEFNQMQWNTLRWTPPHKYSIHVSSESNDIQWHVTYLRFATTTTTSYLQATASASDPISFCYFVYIVSFDCIVLCCVACRLLLFRFSFFICV